MTSPTIRPLTPAELKHVREIIAPALFADTQSFRSRDVLSADELARFQALGARPTSSSHLRLRPRP